MTDLTDRAVPNTTNSPAILTTKLYPPPVSAELESRVNLMARLERNRHRALTLISAPSGYGKSTLASMWLDASETSGCWVSLDEEDDDPHTFLAYVVTAVRSTFPDIRLQARELLETRAFPPSSTVARILLNDLEQLPQRILLVLDDLHYVRSLGVYEIIAELLRHPSPKLHLVLISRRDPPLPLPSLRAHRQITEIRARDLRFTNAETAGFLSKVLRREIDDATAAQWTERTEGWVTALGLAAMSLRQRNRSALTPDNLPADGQYLQEYLLAEVINQLEPTVKEWLMAIAWLDRFCPALCTAVCQANDASSENGLTGETFVQRLRRDNLFVISLDDENRWFRLHHLFRTLLQSWGRQRYADEEITALHRRAGAWFAQQELPEEAIRYLIAAGDYAAAEQLLLQHRYALMNTLQWSRLVHLLNYFPNAVLEQSALLMCTAAVVSFHSGHYEEAVAAAQKAEQLLAKRSSQSLPYNALLGEVLVIKGGLAVASGDAQAVAAYAEHSLKLLPADAPLLRSLAISVIASGRQMSGQDVAGRRLLEEAINESQWTQPIRIRLMHYLCILSFMQGDLVATQVWAGRAEQLAEDHGYPVASSMARYFQGAVHYLHHNFDAAEPYLRAVLQDRVLATTSYLTMSTFALASIYNSRGDFVQADAIIDETRTYYQSARNLFALNTVQAFTVDLAWRRDDLEAAQRKRIGVDFHCKFPLWLFYIPRLTPIKLLLAEGTPDALSAARATLEELAQKMAKVHRNMARIDILALLALVCDAQEDTIAASASLSTALACAQEGDIIQPFLDLGTPMAKVLQHLCEGEATTLSGATRKFGLRVLVAFQTATPIRAAQTSSAGFRAQAAPALLQPLEPLTPREVQILHQLASAATPTEIAAQNVVSVSTVRSQIKSVYRKLDVHNRMEAIKRGRELEIV